MPDIFNPDLSPNLAIVGDLHRNHWWADEVLDYCRDHGVDVIIQVGDFGYVSPRQNRHAHTFISMITDKAKYYGIEFLWIDGNHEHHHDLLAVDLNSRGVRKITDSITHLPRGFRWSWSGVDFLALGGAHSVDRSVRVKGVDWFPEELITFGQAREVCESGATDVMFTHDCPDRVDIPLADNSWIPRRELQLSQRHREFLGCVVDVVKPKHLFHGHYHVRYDGQRVDEEGHTVQIHGLGMDNTSMSENVLLIPDVLELGC